MNNAITVGLQFVSPTAACAALVQPTLGVAIVTRDCRATASHESTGSCITELASNRAKPAPLEHQAPDRGRSGYASRRAVVPADSRGICLSRWP